MKGKLSRKWWISIGVTVVLAALLGVTGAALAQNSADDPVPGSILALGGGPSEAMAFTYQGRLMDGGAPANGNYDFIIDLYDNPTVGSPVASCANVGTGSLLNQTVQNGVFTFYLLCGDGNSDVFTGGERWLQVQARRTGTPIYTTLPRQPISPTPYAFSLYPGAIISDTATGGSFGTAVLNVYNRSVVSTGSAIYAQSATGSAVRSESVDGIPVLGYTENGYGVYGYDGGSTQARGYAGYFYSGNGVGVYGYSNGTRSHPNIYSPGVYGRSANGVGVYGRSDTGTTSWTSAGVMGWGYANPGGQFYSYSGNPIEGWEDQNGDGYTLNLRFKVTYTGEVYADGNFHSGGADLAEMSLAVAGLEPGDVLVVDSDGKLTRSTEAYQSTIVGVYSTKPGFVGGSSDEEDSSNKVPLAIVGIAPVKASAENGPIHPGDLLTASSTPGHAMKAGPNPPIGTVIGKALGTLEAGTGVIQMLVTLQ
jgi:hypothetical protein